MFARGGQCALLMPLIIFPPIGWSRNKGLCILHICRREDESGYGLFTPSRIHLPLGWYFTHSEIFCYFFLPFLIFFFRFVLFVCFFFPFFFLFFFFLLGASTGVIQGKAGFLGGRTDVYSMEWCGNMLIESDIQIRFRQWLA